MTIQNLTLMQAVHDLREKKYSSFELTQAYIAQINKLQPTLNAFITLSEKEALIYAKQADEKIKNGETLPFLGVPIALKDLFLTKGVKTTAGAKVLDNYIPQYDGTVVRKLKDAGAVILGKTNCDAWAHGSSGENSDFGPAKNPYNREHVPGGSSSGSPVAVAADMCLAASGTDTGGSIRLPASFCNVVGLKPTYGRVSRYGIVAMSSSLDSIGHFTKTVEDNAYFLNVTAGSDPKDATTPPEEVPDYTATLKKGVKGIKIGVPKEFFMKGLDPKIKDMTLTALKDLEKEGAELVDISLPHTEYAIAVYYIIQTAEVSSNLARYDGIRYGKTRAVFADEAKRRIMLGTYVLSAGYYDAYYKKAMQVRTLIRQDFEEAFTKVDAIITPCSPTLPWKLGQKTADPLAMYLSDTFTVTGNLAGIPGLSIPIGFLHNLPVGMQILGKQFSENVLYQIGNTYEQINPVWKIRPTL